MEIAASARYPANRIYEEEDRLVKQTIQYREVLSDLFSKKERMAERPEDLNLPTSIGEYLGFKEAKV